MAKILCFFVLVFCGASAIYHEPNSRITAGTFARENEFPYAVSLQQTNQLNVFTRGHRCGGVLITYQHVLTAASCTYTYNVGAPPTPIVLSEHRVFAGSVVLTNDTALERVRFIMNVTRHPDYTGAPAMLNDLAIITLNMPFQNSTVTPLAVPPASFQPAEGAQCVVVGWGSENSSSTASVNLKYARKYISGQNICRLQYNLEQGGPNILPSMICAASFDILSNGCTGDFGNGLVCNGGLVGILSITNKCVVTSYPEVYTRVSNYTTWIRTITGGASTFQPGVAVLVVFAVVQFTRLITMIIS